MVKEYDTYKRCKMVANIPISIQARVRRRLMCHKFLMLGVPISRDIPLA